MQSSKREGNQIKKLGLNFIYRAYNCNLNSFDKVKVNSKNRIFGYRNCSIINRDNVQSDLVKSGHREIPKFFCPDSKVKIHRN